MASSNLATRVATPTSPNKNPLTPALDVVTLSDISQQVVTNAAILFPKERNLRVVTAQAPSGLLYYCMLVADKPQPKEARYKIDDFKIVVKSQGTQDRRRAILDLLEETEKRVGKELLSKQ
ncbi:MAG: hypothetical protein M1821_000062 [Bathelium mastoideum]|nr:MAG: hypothetical protein M1821_000062 [Bathelium mastoideum]KAI9687906.1 MAG: hypothetical protein M1822_001988 [Bathelium mastoideum]